MTLVDPLASLSGLERAIAGQFSAWAACERKRCKATTRRSLRIGPVTRLFNKGPKSEKAALLKKLHQIFTSEKELPALPTLVLAIY